MKFLFENLKLRTETPSGMHRNSSVLYDEIKRIVLIFEL